MSPLPIEINTVLDGLNTEIELIEASLLPVESLSAKARDALPLMLSVKSDESRLSLRVEVRETYPEKDAVKVEVKGDGIGREEAEIWKAKVQELMLEWDDQFETPLYNIMTTSFLPLLAAAPASPPHMSPIKAPELFPIAHHALITTHHLLSGTKRKNLVQLSSELNLKGFSKVGHPGILYAIGEKEDIDDWLVEVRSWNWLALKVRITCERDPECRIETERLKREGVAGAVKERGDWVELHKLTDALDWMRKRGRERLLTDAGVGTS